jgi:hypothetical protein
MSPLVRAFSLTPDLDRSDVPRDLFERAMAETAGAARAALCIIRGYLIPTAVAWLPVGTCISASYLHGALPPPLWIPIAESAAIFLAMWLLFARSMRQRRLRLIFDALNKAGIARGERCGYLYGLSSSTCPECGDGQPDL